MNKPFVALDSCVLVSFFIDDDRFHEEAKKIILHLFSKPRAFTVLLSPLVLYETSIVAMRSGQNEDVISDRLYRLLSQDEVLVVSLSELSVFKHIRHTTRLHVREPQIRSHDMLILNTAKDFSALMVTFDNRLVQVCRNIKFSTCSSERELIDHTF